MTKPHKYAEAIKAWADGKPIQCRIENQKEWIDWDTDRLRNLKTSALFYPFDVPRFDQFEWRVKPEAIVIENYIWPDDNCTRLSVSSSPNVRFTFDPETKSLIKAEVIR